jgi:SAM-dependent methyltransferase
MKHPIRPDTWGRHGLLDVIEGHYLALVMDTLHREGVLWALSEGVAVGHIASAGGLDDRLLRDLLEFVALRSTLIARSVKRGRVRFTVAGEYATSPRTAHLLDQYVGAYGPCLNNLSAILRAPTRGSSCINLRRHAAAFARCDGAVIGGEVIRLIEELQIGTVLDIGCGSGAMLAELATRHSHFTGIGIDTNAGGVVLARRRIARAGLASRIHILHADVFTLGRRLSTKVRAPVEAIVAVSVANAFFKARKNRAIHDFLRYLRRSFPRRILILADYYGRLGRKWGDATKWQRTVVHDVVQTVSGQGIPPPTRDEWLKIYDRAACTLIRTFDGESDGVQRFIHIVQL